MYVKQYMSGVRQGLGDISQPPGEKVYLTALSDPSARDAVHSDQKAENGQQEKSERIRSSGLASRF